MIFIPIFIFCLGLLVGSFLNVVIFRLNTGRSVVTGRSRCDRCDRTLSWYELVPVFSFLGLRGKCRSCQTELSFQHPIIELLTGIVFALLYTTIVMADPLSLVTWATFVFALVISSLLIVITVYDFKHKIVPDKIVYPFILISFLSVFWGLFFGGATFNLLNALIAGPALALPFFLLWFFSQGRAMGFGDVKLALGIGWLVGIEGSLTVFLLSFWIGAIVGLFLLAISKRHSFKSEVPFAPFMITALAITVIWGITVQQIFPLW